jgi:isoamylase
MNDLVSYNDKHNEANGENNQDGIDDNRSWNCGAEGPTDDLMVLEWRKRQKRNFLTTLFLSQGVPLLLSGDEISRTQNGNNNAYCQDNEISWTDWENADTDLLEFTRKLIHLRMKHPVFRRSNWFQGEPMDRNGLKDIEWFLPEGIEMEDEHWDNDNALSLAIFLNGHGIHSYGKKGEKPIDDSFYLMFNASHIPIEYKLLPEKYGTNWRLILDTSKDLLDDTENSKRVKGTIRVEGRSVVVLQHPLNKPEQNGNAD